MSIHITNPKAKCKRGYKLASQIVSYLFEEEYGECENFSASEIATIRKAAKILAR